MEKEREIKKIWRETFGDSYEWIDLYFGAQYRDEDALLLMRDNAPVSSMLLPRYEMLFHGSTVGMGYVSGAATRRRYRGQGLMSELLVQALHMARDRGDALISLIPAHGWLFYYYEHRGFATMFYTAEQRYVAPHRFLPQGEYEEADPADFYDTYARLNGRRQAVVAHAPDDFQAILSDIALDGGQAVAAIRPGESEPAAFAFVVPDEEDNTLIVKDLLAEDDDSREAVLAMLKDYYPDMGVIIKEPAHEGDDGKKRPLQPLAMARIVNPLPLLRAYAAAHPKERMSLRLTDSLLPANSGVYVLAGDGTVSKCIADDNQQEFTLDVDINTLGSILFSSRKIGEIFGIRTTRPVMTLMMD